MFEYGVPSVADIFISYKREDCERIKPLALALEGLGWSVFWDPNIQPGHTYDSLIEAELDRAKAVVVAWSDMSVKSEWVRAEAQRAKERGILVPIHIDETKPPLAFTLIQSASMSGWSGDCTQDRFKLLVSRLEELAGTPQRLSKADEQRRLEAEACEVWEDIKTSGNPAVIERFASLYEGTEISAKARKTLAAGFGWNWSKHLYRWPVYVSVLIAVLTAIGLEHHRAMLLKYNLALSLLAFIASIYTLRLLRYMVRGKSNAVRAPRVAQSSMSKP